MAGGTARALVEQGYKRALNRRLREFNRKAVARLLGVIPCRVSRVSRWEAGGQAMADKSYPTDLKDKEWKLLEPLLVRNRGRRGKRKHDLRRIVDGCFYVLRGGISWRMMPHDLPHWDDVYSHFRKW